MSQQWTREVVVRIRQLEDGSRVWVDVEEQRNGDGFSTSRREAFYDSSLLSQELSSWMDDTCRSFCITETVGAIR